MLEDKNSKTKSMIIDVDFLGKYENMKKFAEYVHQKYYEITGFPKNRLNNSNK